jgi:hypothetical protein
MAIGPLTVQSSRRGAVRMPVLPCMLLHFSRATGFHAGTCDAGEEPSDRWKGGEACDRGPKGNL